MIQIYNDTTVGTSEFIALFNPNLEPVDLKGYQFTDDITHMIEGAPLFELQGYYMDLLYGFLHLNQGYTGRLQPISKA